MFDSPQVPTPVEPLIDSEHAAALILIHPKLSNAMHAKA